MSSLRTSVLVVLVASAPVSAQAGWWKPANPKVERRKTALGAFKRQERKAAIGQWMDSVWGGPIMGAHGDGAQAHDEHVPVSERRGGRGPDGRLNLGERVVEHAVDTLAAPAMVVTDGILLGNQAIGELGNALVRSAARKLGDKQVAQGMRVAAAEYGRDTLGPMLPGRRAAEIEELKQPTGNRDLDRANRVARFVGARQGAAHDRQRDLQAELGEIRRGAHGDAKRLSDEVTYALRVAPHGMDATTYRITGERLFKRLFALRVKLRDLLREEPTPTPEVAGLLAGYQRAVDSVLATDVRVMTSWGADTHPLLSGVDSQTAAALRNPLAKLE